MKWVIKSYFLLVGVFTKPDKTETSMVIFLLLGMGFRPMPDIDSTSIGVYGDSASQNKTVASLTNYRFRNYVYRKFHFEQKSSSFL